MIFLSVKIRLLKERRKTTHISPSTLGELLAHGLELTVPCQEDLHIGELVHYRRHPSAFRPEPEGLRVLLRRSQWHQSWLGNVDLLDHVVLGEWAHLEPNWVVAWDQAIKPLNPRRQLLDCEDRGQAGSVAGVDYQHHEEPYDQHHASKSAHSVLS